VHQKSEVPCQLSNISLQKPGSGDVITETNLITEFGASLEETVLNDDIILTGDNGDVRVGASNHRCIDTEDVGEESDIVFRRGRAYPTSEDDFFSQRRKGILLQKGLSLGLENILEEYNITDPSVLKGNNIPQNYDYSDIIGKIVNFRGHDVTVASLIGETIFPETEILLNEFKRSFSKGSKPVIGFPCIHNVDHYVPRTLQRKVIVRSDIFKHKTSKVPDVFAVSGMTKQEFQELVPRGENICEFNESSGIENAVPRFILLDDLTAERDYDDLCKRARNFKDIHWLSKQMEGLEWKKSKGSLDIIHQYIEPNKFKHILSLIDMKEETVILSGHNGEGKSTYLTNLQSEISEKYPTTWVIRLNLNEHANEIAKFDMTENLTIEMLSSAAGLGISNSSLEKELLKYSLKVTKNAVVLVDEIGFRQTNKSQELLRILENMNMKKLIITTHSHITTKIENLLSTLAFTLKPLSYKELQMLMTKLWKTNLLYTEDTYCKEFSTALLHLIEKPSVKGNVITPFDIKILAHAFEKDYTTLLKTKVIDLPEHVDMIEIYDKYLKWGFEIYTRTSLDFDKSWDSYLADITHSSMLSLFSEETVKTFMSREDTEDTKIKFPFLHQSVQDFVTAKWLTENYHVHRSFIQDKYFEAELQTMWEMYDRILAKQCELHTSVLDRNIQEVRDLISSGFDINSLDSGGRTALHLAVMQGKYFVQGDSQCVQIASLLVDQGADVSITDSVLNWTVLRYADMSGSWSMIDRLLQRTSDLNDMVRTKQKLLNHNFLQEILSNAAADGLTYLTAFILSSGVDVNMPLHSTKYSHQQYGLLHVASENGHTSLVEFLLENGADVNMYNWNNSTPLHLACYQGHKECVLVLLKGFAHINQSNKNGDTPLHVAVRAGNCDIVQILLTRGADLDLRNKYGDTALHVACQENNLTAVSHLMSKDADENVRNNNGDSPLDYAIKGGHTALVRYILKRAGRGLMHRGGDGRTYVHLAAITGDVLMLDYLLQVLPEVNVGTAGGDTPLHLASLHGNTDAAVFLLTRGAENNEPNNYGNTPLHLASLRGNINTLRALIEHDAQVNACNREGNTPLHLAAIQGKANVARCLINYGADVDIRNREKDTPLLLAATKGDLEVMGILVAANADVNLLNRYGNTILHQCARNGRLDIVELLLHTGHCDVDARNSKGETPLLAATRSGFIGIVECLALAGADINFLQIEGNSPVDLAVMDGNVELVTKLCDLGADVNIRNSEGDTPLHSAVSIGNEVLIRHLVGHGADKSIQNIKGCTPFDLAVVRKSTDSVLHML
jgi:ankyrin repeat protein